jgi:hypothetical protein
MIDISTIETLDHKRAWEAEIFAYFKRLLINVLSREVLCDATVVSVRELRPIHFVIEEVVHIHVIHITLYALQVNIG